MSRDLSGNTLPKFYFIQVQDAGTDLGQETSYLDFQSGFSTTLDSANNRARVTVSYTTLGFSTPVGNSGKILRSDNTNWVASTFTIADTYAQGAIPHASTANTLTALAIGASGRFLESSGTLPQWTAPGDLTKVDDTNVTLTLGGTPIGSLLKATSLTLGWTGTLAAARLNANVVQAITNDTNITGSIAAQNLTLAWAGTLAAARLNANVVQGVTNDTNVTGSIATQALTLGWAGTLAVARGGTGQGTYSPALLDTSLTSGRVPFATTNGRLTDDSDLTFATDTLTVTKISTPTIITASGDLTLAPVSRVKITAPNNNYGLFIDGNDTTGQSYGLHIDAGTNNVDHAMLVRDASGASTLLKVFGNGTVSFGTHTALGAETVTGYISTQDALGNSRKLAVVS